MIISICDKKNVFFFRPLSNFAQFEWFVNFALILGNLKASQTSCEFHLMDNYAPKTFDGLKKMHEFNKYQNGKKEEVLLKSITQPL